MINTVERTAILRRVAARHWTFEIEPYSRMPQKTLEDVRDDHRLKRMLKCAVMRDYAQQSLIDSIKNEIRK
ncbi:MAG: hypothetical protein WBD27_07570 [Pyrinomonadaceae bacterium]